MTFLVNAGLALLFGFIATIPMWGPAAYFLWRLREQPTGAKP